MTRYPELNLNYIKCACSADLIATMEAPVGKNTDPRKGAGLRYIFSRALSYVEATGSNNSYRRVVLGFSLF